MTDSVHICHPTRQDSIPLFISANPLSEVETYMPTIRVEVDWVVGAVSPDVVPWEQLKALFSTANIDLRISQGRQISWDPSHHPRKTYRWIVEKLRAEPTPPRSPKPARLIFGIKHAAGPRVNGEMVDRESRGVAVCFTHSNYIRTRGVNGLIEVAAHEIGHLLNLLERRESGDYSSAMHNSSRRRGTPLIAWQGLQREVREIVDQGQDPLFNAPDMPPTSLRCFPLNYSSRSWLRHPHSPDKLRPWKSRYRCGEEDVHDESNPYITVSIQTSRGGYVVGGPLHFTLLISSSAKSNVRIAMPFGPEFGTVQLRITRPDRSCYLHKDRSLARANGYTYLRPQSCLSFQFCFIDGPGGAVFPVEGEYLVEAVLPSIGARSNYKTIRVEKAPASELANSGFRRFLADGALANRTRHSGSLKRLLKMEHRLPKSVSTYLALLHAPHVKNRKEANQLLQVANSPDAPQTVRDNAQMMIALCDGRNLRERRVAIDKLKQLRKNTKKREEFTDRLTRLIASLRQEESINEN